MLVTFLPLRKFDDFFFRDQNLTDLVGETERVRARAQRFRHLALETRIGVDDVPVFGLFERNFFGGLWRDVIRQLVYSFFDKLLRRRCLHGEFVVIAAVADVSVRSDFFRGVIDIWHLILEQTHLLEQAHLEDSLRPPQWSSGGWCRRL